MKFRRRLRPALLGFTKIKALHKAEYRLKCPHKMKSLHKAGITICEIQALQGGKMLACNEASNYIMKTSTCLYILVKALLRERPFSE
jgi:hypothetical protein